MSGVPVLQSEAAAKGFRAFLLPLVGERLVHTKVVNLMGQLRPKGGRKGANQVLWTLTRENEPVYATAQTVEYLALALQAEHRWSWPPVLFYASGWLQSLVKTVATVNLRRISSPRLLELLAALPGAVEGETEARRRWVLTGTEQSAFSDLSDAEGLLQGRPLPDDLAVALALSTHFEIGADLLRDRVLNLLMSWASDVVAKELKAGIRTA